MHEMWVLIEGREGKPTHVHGRFKNPFTIKDHDWQHFEREGIRFHVLVSDYKGMSIEQIKHLLDVYWSMLVYRGYIVYLESVADENATTKV